MKKLLSICFLSILLGLMSFSMRAQSSGFWIENLKPATYHGVVNAPDGSGDLVLNNTLNVAMRDSIDLYELHFCSDVPDSLKISVDWLLYRNGQLVNENLSDYAEIDMYTWYPELNNQGNAMAIHWVGGRLPNAFGYCDQPVQPDMFSGYNCGHAPTNYPGALQVGQGTPHSVLNALDEWVNAQGLYSIYTEAFDYFYAKFFQYGRTVVQIKWKQVGNYSLVMRIRERRGGTDWYNAYYNNDERLHVGGHMSCCGSILASDSIHYLVTGDFSKEVCQDAVPFTYGNPPYDFYETIEDTNVVFGHNDPLHCNIFVVDSINAFHFFVRHNPVVQVAKHVDTLCSCDEFTADMFGVSLDPVDLDVATDTVIQWYHWGANAYGWYTDVKPYRQINHQTDTTYMYIVRQVNTYNTFGEEIVCEGDPDTMYITFRRIEAPVLSDNYEVCLDAIDSTTVHHATATHDEHCATTTRWYTKYNSSYSELSYYIDQTSLVYTGDDFPINLSQYAPTTNTNKTVYFYAVSYNDSTGCMSKFVTKYKITYHQTPVISKVTSPDTINCPGAEVTMKIKIDNNNANNDKPFTYMWNGVDSILFNGTKVPFVGEVEKTVIGDPVSFSVNKYIPMSLLSDYNYSQQIFTAAEVGKGLITKISFECNSGTNFTKNNVSIMLAPTTTDNFGFSGKTWVTEGLETVFNGTITANAAGWCTITLDQPYLFDGLTNLVVAVSDASGAHGTGSFKVSFAPGSSPSYYKTLYAYGNNPVGVNSNPTHQTQRSNIRFTVESTDFTTIYKNQEAYFNIPDTAKCNDSYTSNVYVINNHGCVSNPVEFNYGVGVRTAPRLRNVPTAPVKIYACELNADNTPAYTSIEDLEEAGIKVIDDCGKGMTLTSTQTMRRGVCHDTLDRVYTIHNLCDSTVSFTQTFISYDTVKPIFVRDTMELPLVQLKPVPAGNCTFNSPDSMEFVKAVAAMVYDNCTDSAFLMSTVQFFWENTHQSPINDTNIFRVNNHLTVTAVINDICGNYSDTTLVIYLDQPDSMRIIGDPIELPTVCEGVTPANLVFDTTRIQYDQFVGPFLPYSYEWSEVNGREVTFTNKYAKETGINPVGSGDFVFQLKVTDGNGCEALSGYYFLHINPIPNPYVTEIPYGGATRPYCPTYGWMTVGVFDANTGNKYPASANMSYTWEGEGVNVHSILDTTIVNIVPDSCDHDYMAIVTVADEIGCSAKDTVIFPVRDTEGPAILPGVLHDTILTPDQECKLRVPNYRPLLNASNVTSKCGYSPTKILETYTQTPAAGTVTTKDTTVITITLSTPCGKDSVYTVYAFKPDNYVTVNVTVDGDSVCENDPVYMQNGITLTANAQYGTAPYTYQWTKGASTTVIGTDASLTVFDTNGVYTYHVAVKDAHNCPVSDEADITIWYKGAPAITSVTPNRICDGHNGTLTIIEAPTGYTYEFQGQIKTSDNASHEPTINNTVYFSGLYPGTFTLTITTPDPENCETTKEITIPNVTAEVDTVVATPLAVSNCLDNNGAITITRQEGYTYYFSNDGGATYEVTELTVIPSLASGTYWFYRVNDATNCESPRTSVYVPYNAPDFNFTINSINNNSICYQNQGDGSFKLVTSNVNYVVTLGNDTIYEGPAATVSNLVAGTYSIYGISTTNGCFKTKTQRITDGNQVNPTATVSTTPNRFCDETQANGTISVTNITQNASYTVLKNGVDTVQPADYSNLYAASYTVNLISAKGCTKSYTKSVNDNKVLPNLSVNTKTNSTCIPEDFDGKITITVSNATAAQAGTSFTYMLWQDGGDTTTQTNGTFTGLASGAYNYAVISQYGCERTGEKTVNQYKVPALDLDSTANYMCEPTATKPGDGTITIMAPRNSATKHYHYKYYDAAGNEYDVPFNEPFVYTLYWLADGMYRVTALELETNCMAEDSIYVPLDRYEVDITATPTANTNCTKNFNGKITVSAESTNPDAKLQFKVVGVDNNYTSEYSFNTEFSGLQNGQYVVMVRDTNTACVYYKRGVEVGLTPHEIVINHTTTDDHACEEGMHDGTLTATATSAILENPYFMYKFHQETEYTDVHTWTGLNSAVIYTVSALDTVSGCSVDSVFTIPLNNVCAPIISITGRDTFCINEEGAELCATATNNTDVCPAGRFSYKWTIDCHSETYNSACVPVLTDEVHCCNYVVHVYDTVSGCTSRDTMRVCVVGIDTITYLINHQIFTANPRTYYHCVSDSVTVGITPANWVTAYWTNNYVTPATKPQPDLEFGVSANANVPGAMYSYCVDVTDRNGCKARGVINLVANPIPTNTVRDTACFVYDKAPFENEPIVFDPSVTYPVTRTKSYTRIDPYHCDSVVTYQIVVLPHVEANFDTVTKMLDSVYCAPTNALRDMRDSVKYQYGQLAVQILRNNKWANFTQLENLTYNYTDSTFRFMVYNTCDTVNYQFQISMDKTPVIDTFELETFYCASEDAVFYTTVSEFSNNHLNANYSSCTVKMYFEGDEAHPLTAIPSANVKGELQKFSFAYRPTMADNGKTLVVKVSNNCNTVTKTQTLVVDTTYINVPDVELCENDTLNFVNILGTQVNSYDNLQAYLIPVTGAHATVPAVSIFNVVDTIGNYNLSNGTLMNGNYNIGENISWTSFGAKYYSNLSTGKTLNFYNSNTLTVTVQPGYRIHNITFYGVNNSDNNLPSLNVDTNNVRINNLALTSSNGKIELGGMNITGSVKFTNNGGQFKISRIAVSYSNIPDNTPVITYEYGNAETYVPGTELGLEYDHAKIYFTGHGKCGNITSDTAIVTVNPNLVFDPMGTGDVCIDEAVEFISNSVYIDYADTTCWLYAGNVTDTILNEGFENFTNWDAIGWQIFDADGDNQNWLVGDPSEWNVSVAHTGSKVVSSWSWNNSPFDPDNWLISPAVSIPANATLTYYDRGNWRYPDHYSVYVITTSDYHSINNNDLVASFNTSSTQQGTTGNASTWTKRTIDLSSYVGQNVYIAFRHHDSRDENFLFIDDIIIDGRELVPVKNVTELVDSIKSMPQADVYFYAANGCDTLLEEVGTFRILGKPTVAVNSITVCPNAKFVDLKTSLNAHFTNMANYTADELTIDYYGKVGNTYTLLNDNDVLSTAAAAGTIRVIGHVKELPVYVPNCGQDTVYSTLTILVNDTNTPALDTSCIGNTMAQFIDVEPEWQGSNGLVTSEFWTVRFYNSNLNLPDSIVNPEVFVPVQETEPVAFYTWITSCKDTIVSDELPFEFYINPEMTLTPDTIHVCLNDTLYLTQVGLGLYDPYQLTKGKDTVWTLLGETVTDYVVVTNEMNGAALYATIESTCKSAVDSTIIMVDTLPVVNITGPARACTNTDVTFNATPGFESYVFVINDVEQPEQRTEDMGADASSITTHVTATEVEFTYANVIVTDGNGCKSNAEEDAAVRVTAMPEFMFFDTTGIANSIPDINGGKFNPADDTHTFTATTGKGMKYVWMVNNECYTSDTLVYVEYDIYFNGRKLTNDSIDDWYLIPSTYNNHGQSPRWVTSNRIFWEANDHTAKNNLSYYNYAYGDPSIYVNENEYGGNHYPNSNMGFANNNVYDDLWMHYLANRPVTQEISGFRRQGEYKIVFRLYATSNPNKFYHPYTHTDAEGNQTTKYIGGSNANANDAIIDLLAMDSITITVTGEDIIDPSILNPNEAPNLAPALVVDETVVPDMEVWPNPAPATETTLKARVHNMAGNATVTLTNLNGKQVYNGNIYIDNDNYYFEFGINNLSVGSYIMTVRTDEAVITKKVIVTVLR